MYYMLYILNNISCTTVISYFSFKFYYRILMTVLFMTITDNRRTDAQRPSEISVFWRKNLRKNVYQQERRKKKSPGCPTYDLKASTNTL